MRINNLQLEHSARWVNLIITIDVDLASAKLTTRLETELIDWTVFRIRILEQHIIVESDRSVASGWPVDLYCESVGEHLTVSDRIIIPRDVVLHSPACVKNAD